jgi:hypothetical protein
MQFLFRVAARKSTLVGLAWSDLRNSVVRYPADPTFVAAPRRAASRRHPLVNGQSTQITATA